MTTTDAEQLGFVRAICERPDDDTARLVFADWLQEHGDGARAEFVRVQVELARCPGCKGLGVRTARVPPTTCQVDCWDCAELRRRERELFQADERRTLDWFGLPQPWARVVRLEKFEEVPTDYAYAVASRGFLSAVTCTAADWLKHSPVIHWHEGQTVECPECQGRKGYRNPTGGFREFSGSYPMWESCYHCSGTGRVPRPCPATAMPVEHVTLTTWPDELLGEHNRRNERYPTLLEDTYPGVVFAFMLV